jgi:hypothetical protein
VGENKHMAARLLGIDVKTLCSRLEEYRLLYGQFGLRFLLPSLLLCQNDPDFHATSFVSGQSDRPRLSLRSRRTAPRRVYRA